MRQDKDKLNYEILARYLADEGDRQDMDKVRAWLDTDPVNIQKLKEFELIWKSASVKHDLKRKWFNIEEDWEGIEAKMSEPGQEEVIRKTPQPQINRWGHSGVQQWLRIAAIFLITAFIGFIAYHNGSGGENKEEPILREITTGMGQRVNLTLTDGTKVLLNADSKLRLPKVFESDKREVYLEGEAYFDVTENPEKPFLIHSGASLTRVLGTSFSISAYPEDGGILLVVKEGRVAFEAGSRQTRQQTILTRNELARYIVKRQRVSKEEIDDMEFYLGWIEGYLKFKDEAMSRVAVALKRRYDVTVTFDKPAIRDMRLTASLKSRSIRNVLDVIAKSLDIRYTMQENTITFYQS